MKIFVAGATGAIGKRLVPLLARQLPIVGDGAGIWSFIFNVVDDDPAEVSVWLPLLARLVGAKPPRSIPVWLARFTLGDAGVSMMTAMRGSSNAKAKRSLGWKLAFPTWREGFRRTLSS